ncbi:MAG: RapZ C-terminal domain-containing protein, partial [Chitinophagaceae bacterium]
NFGCTGGQHRSVFAADRLAEHLKEKFNVNAIVEHVEQEAKNWINLTY